MLWLEVMLWAAWAMMLAWWPCCCDEDPECSICSADSDTVTVTFSGIADYGSCDQCNETFNGTFTLTRVDGSPCAWNKSGTWECPAETTKNYYMLVRALSGMPGWIMEVTLGINWGGSPAQTDYYRWASDGTTDCTATHTTTIYSRDVTRHCNMTSATCQIN